MIQINLDDKLDKFRLWSNKQVIQNLSSNIQKYNIKEVSEFDAKLIDGYAGFALVKFFSDTKCIIAKRDFFGCVPLFFKKKSNSWIFSDCLSKIIEHPENINSELINNYLNFNKGYKDAHKTFYTDIFQVPSGALVKITKNNIEINYLNYQNSNDDVCLLDRIKESISINLGNSEINAFHLSGGLDSTGLASISQTMDSEKHKSYFCNVKSDYKSTHESDFQKSFEDKYHSEILNFSSGHNLLETTIKYISEARQPPFLYNILSLQDNLILGVKALGCQNVVSGFGGDNILGHGFEYLKELILKKKEKEIIASIKVLSDAGILKDKYLSWNEFSEQKKYTLTLLHFVFPKLSQEILKGSKFLLWFVKLRGNQTELYLEIIKRLRGKLKIVRYKRLFKKAEEHSTNLEFSYLNQPIKEFDDFHNCSISDINETYYNLNKVYDVNLCFPFLSTKVLNKSMEFSLEQKFDGGLGRGHYREALKGIMPELVRKRIGKTSFDELFENQIMIFLNQVGEISEDHLIWKFVNHKEYENLIRNFTKNNVPFLLKIKEAHLIYKILNLKLWIDNEYT